jgi:hypothetical protein
MKTLPNLDDVFAGNNPAWDYTVEPAADSEVAATSLLRNPPAISEVMMPSERIASGDADLEEVNEYLRTSASFMDNLNPVTAAYSITASLGYLLSKKAEGLTSKSSKEDKLVFNTAYGNALAWVGMNLPEEFLILFIRTTLGLYKMPVDPSTPAFQTYAMPLQDKVLAA